jgi:ribose transport system permease protein
MLVIELVVFSLLAPNTFPTVSNFQNILSSQAIFMIVTLGLTLPVLAGEFDVSVANTLGFTTVLIGYLTVLKEWPFVPALIVCILAGTLVGAVNAVLVVGLGINSFIATIGTGTVLMGFARAARHRRYLAVSWSAAACLLWARPCGGAVVGL